MAATTAKSETPVEAAPLPPPPPGLEVVVFGGAVVDPPPFGPGVVAVGEVDDPDPSDDVVEAGDSVLEAPLGEEDEPAELPAGTIRPPNTAWGADDLAVLALLS